MTSKNSSFNGFIGYCKEGLRRRLWSIALSTLAFFFAYPVGAALIISNTRRNFQYRSVPAGLLDQFIKRTVFSSYRNLISGGAPLPVALLSVLAIMLAVSGFSWLFISKETDFYHSLPARREKLFAAVTADSILIAAVPYALMSAISGFIIMAATGRKRALWVSFTGFVYNMVMFLLCYSVAAFAVMLTGHKMVGILGACAFFVTGPMIIGGIEMLFNDYFKSYFSETSRFGSIIRHTSPTLWALKFANSDMSLSKAVWALLWFIVLTVLTVVLYKKRPSEAAGRAIAFKWAEPVIKVVLSCTIGIFAGAFIRTEVHSDAWTAFGAACGVILTGCILEIIYHADFKKLFSRKKSLLLSALAVLAVFIIFRFDIFGYDRWLPDPGKVASAGVYCDALERDAWSYQQEISLEQNEIDGKYYVVTSMNGADGRGMAQRLADETALPDTGVARRIAEQGIRDIRSGYAATEEYTPSDKERYGEAVISWKLTNGRTVYRRYRMNLSSVKQELDGIHDSYAFKTAMYPALSMDPEELYGINYNAGGYYHLPFSGGTSDIAKQEAAKEILKAWQADMRELTADTRRAEMPVLCLQFKSRAFQAMADTVREQDPYMINSFNNCGYYPVYPSFTRTLALLNKKCGLSAESLLNKDKVLDACILDFRSYFDGEADYTGLKNKGQVVINKEEEIAQILESAVPADLACGNSYGNCYNGIEIMVHYPAGTLRQMEDGDAMVPKTAVYADAGTVVDTGYQDVRTLRFPAESIPGFVLERFGITEEDIRLESGSGGY